MQEVEQPDVQLEPFFYAMRKIIACAALFVSTFAVMTAQELNLGVHSRLEANKPWSSESSTLSNNRINWGNSGLFMTADGSFSDKLSFDSSFSLLTSDPAWLYQNTLGCSDCGWINWLNLLYTPNDRLSFGVGKQIMFAGGWENDPYDFEQHLDLCSQDWQGNNVYQWGGSVVYAPDEDHSYGFQITTSPFRESLLVGNGTAASFQGRHSSGIWAGILSINYLQAYLDEAPALGMITLGNKLEDDNYQAWVDVTLKNALGCDLNGMNTSVTASYLHRFCDGSLELGAKGGYETISPKCPDFFGYSSAWSLEEDGVAGIVPLGISPDKDYTFGGLFFHYYPMEDLRIHAALAVNNYTKAVSATFGVLYSFYINH